jgi:hypothetical protein
MEFSFINTKYENKRNRRKERLLWEIKMREKDDFMEKIRQEIDTRNVELMNLEMQINEALKYINEECVYDKHLQGYCFGLKPGQVRTLVLKLGGRNVKD